MLLRTGLFSCFLTAISGKGQALGGKCHTGVSEQGSSLGVPAVGPCADAWAVPRICLLSGYRKGLWRGKLGITGT